MSLNFCLEFGIMKKLLGEDFKKIMGTIANSALILLRKVSFLWLLSLIFIIVTFFIILYKIDSRGPAVALHYNVITGVDLFGSKNALYKIPATGLFILVINFFVAHSFKKDGEFLAFLAAIVTLIISLSLFASVLFLLKVN